MPETRIVGYDGNITMPTGHAAKIRSWSASFDMAVSETSAFGDSFRQFKGGILGGSGSATGVMSFDASSTAPGVTYASRQTGSSITLTAATGCTYTGTVLVSNIAVSSDKTGDANITFDFVFTGTITETWDQTG